MKKLIFKIIIFCLPLLFAVVIFRAYIIFKKQQPEQYQFDVSIENLLLGHSQPECALNDSIIEKSVNKCQGGEAYFYTYTKLKKLLEVNNQIKTVYLSFSNNQIGKEMDKWTYGNIYILDKYPAYFYEMSQNDKFVLIKENFKSVISAESKILKRNLIDLFKNKGQLKESLYWGEHLPLQHQKVDSLIKENYIEKIVQQNEKGFSTVNIDYLKKIVDLCKKENVQLVFFRLPVHELLRETFDEKAFDSIRRKHFNSVLFLDCANYTISNDKFVDFSHLNYKGANEFSEFFNQLVQNKSITAEQVNDLIKKENSKAD
jgi:hypothetical protein